jgi:hypothetical protein
MANPDLIPLHSHTLLRSHPESLTEYQTFICSSSEIGLARSSPVLQLPRPTNNALTLALSSLRNAQEPTTQQTTAQSPLLCECVPTDNSLLAKPPTPEAELIALIHF